MALSLAEPLASASTAAQLDELLERWKALASAPLAPAAASLPGWTIPQLKHLGQGRLSLVPVTADDRIAGLFPLQHQRFRWGLPLSVLTSWTTPLSFSGLPLLAREDAQQGLMALLRDMQASALLLQAAPADGPFWDALVTAAAAVDAHIHICDSWERAALRPTQSYDEWFESNFERKRRKEYRRLRSRLAEQGKLQSLTWSADMPLQPWITELVALEARGWKGKRGTALASDEAVAGCLKEALHALAEENCLRFWKLSLDGKAIAIMFAIVHGEQAWLGKIAYDEVFAKFSPGALLILDATESLMSDHSIKLVDSCAIPGHPLIDNIWRDRIKMADVLISAADTASITFKAMVMAETLRRRGRVKLRDAYYAMKGLRRS
jgi:CelD/BcsL family acetyltransferase involved in cellulose biosynthesis